MKNKHIKYAAMLLAVSSFLYPISGIEAASLSLQDAVDMAMEHNISIKIAQQGEVTSRAILKAARGENSPSFSLSGSLSTSKNNDNPRGGSGNGTFSVKMPIYNGGKNAANIDSGSLEVQSSILKTYREMEDVKLMVIKAYYDVLESQKRVNVNKESVENYKAHLTNVQQLYSAGRKAKIDVLRSSVELANAKQTLIKAQNTYKTNVCTLKNVLYMSPNEPLTLTEDFSYKEFKPDLQNCVNYALSNRKDLTIDNNIIQQKELAIKMANAGFLPTISVTASTNGAHDFIPNKDDSHGFSAGLNASWNIFDNGVTQASVDRAKAARDIAVLSLEQDKNNIDLAVRKAYYNMREAEKRFASTQAAVGQAEEDYFIAREKYRAGEGLMLDIIDAQLALSTARLNHISAQYDYVRYKATVENELGLGINENIETALPVTVSASNKELIKADTEAAKHLLPERVLPDADFAVLNTH